MNFFYLPIYIFSALLFWQYDALRLDKLTKYKIVCPTTLIDYGTSYTNGVGSRLFGSLPTLVVFMSILDLDICLMHYFKFYPLSGIF